MTVRIIGIGSQKGAIRYDDAIDGAMNITGIPANRVLYTSGPDQFDPSEVGGGGGGVGDVSGPGAGTTANSICTFANTTGMDIQQNQIGAGAIQADASNNFHNVAGIDPTDDAQVHIGRLKVGDVIGITDYAGIAHEDNATLTNFMICQNAPGSTYINGATGQRIEFQINNVWQAQIWADKMFVPDGVSAAAPGLAFKGSQNSGFRESANTIYGVTLGVDRFVYGAHGFAMKGGAAASPGYNFWADNDTGLGSDTANECFISCAGAVRAEFTAQGIGIQDGLVTSLSLYFINQTNLGLYCPSANQMGFVANGIETFRVMSNSIRPMLDGSLGSNAIMWGNDTNNGWYRAGSDHVVQTAGGNAMLGVKVNRVYVKTSTFLSLWGDSGNYGFIMGSGTAYHYGPVTNYSIKASFNGTSNRGFTVGVLSTAPTHAFDSVSGDFQHKGDGRVEGDMRIDGQHSYYNGADITSLESSNQITITASAHNINVTGTINNIYGYGDRPNLVLVWGFGYSGTLGHNTGDAGVSRIWSNTSASVAFSTLEAALLRFAGGIWSLLNGTDP